MSKSKIISLMESGKKLDRINFRVEYLPHYASYLYARYQRYAVNIYINGKNLIDILADAERQGAEKSNRPNRERARGYAGIMLYEFLDYVEGRKAYTYVLGCGCGIVECGPLGVEIEKTENVVIWRNFSSDYYRYPYDLYDSNWSEMPIFIFDLKQYNEEIEKVERIFEQEEQEKREREEYEEEEDDDDDDDENTIIVMKEEEKYIRITTGSAPLLAYEDRWNRVNVDTGYDYAVVYKKDNPLWLVSFGIKWMQKDENFTEEGKKYYMEYLEELKEKKLI
jgi:hypothetical protein